MRTLDFLRVYSEVAAVVLPLILVHLRAQSQRQHVAQLQPLSAAQHPLPRRSVAQLLHRFAILAAVLSEAVV